ncbi:MAG: beta-galactosidase, partial [Pricia sp.]
PTWTQKRKLSPFYLYKDLHKNPDYAPVRYDSESYPAFAAELGGGIMATYDRRPIVLPKSVDALINRCLGSGANGIGYYMYHGGSTPKGKGGFLSDEAVGATKISYDFQAPIGEFGQTKESYHRLKLIHYFLNSFGNHLATMTTVLPKTNADIEPDDTETLRYAVRHRGDSGFLFINNFQDHKSTKDKEGIQIEVKTADGPLLIPENGGFSLQSDENAIFPFNFDLSGVQLNYATAQLLTKSEDEEDFYYVFFAPDGVRPQFSFGASEELKIVNSANTKIQSNGERWLVDCPADGPSEFILKKDGRQIKVLVVDKKFALKSWPVAIENRKHLLFTDADVLQRPQGIALISKEKNKIELFAYPKIESAPTSDHGSLSRKSKNKLMSHFEAALPETPLAFTSSKTNDRRLVVSLDGGMPDNLHDVILKIDYTGDTAMGFLANELVVDEFYKGMPWEIGLRHFIRNKGAEEMNFYFRPIFENAPFLVDLKEENKPDFSAKKTMVRIGNITFVPVYKTRLEFR